ncbi:MAG: hypothetical protein QM820_24425 [Minicystis sp.]
MPGLPLGSTQIAQWAASSSLGYEPMPDEILVPPLGAARHHRAAGAVLQRGHVVRAA